jgi:predicted TPR repeat methyltransferase
VTDATAGDSGAGGLPPGDAVDALDEGMLAFISGDDDAAAAAFTRALEASPGYDDALYMLGMARARLGDTAGAVDALHAAWQASDNVMLRDYAARKLEALGAPTPTR